MRILRFLALAPTFAMLLLPATTAAQDGNFMVRYATNLNPTAGVATDTVINLTNTGASLGRQYPGAAPSGATLTFSDSNICANVYVFSSDEQLQECCSCLLTPNALASYSAIGDLISNTLTTAKPNSIVIKLLGTVGFRCNAATAGQLDGLGFQVSIPAPGLAAWARNAQGGETPFQTATLTPAELARATALCAFNQVNGSGSGVCRKACKADGQ